MNRIFFLLIFFLISFSLSAQFYVKPGIKVGGNYSTLFGDNPEKANGLFGFHVGGLTEIVITRKGNIFFQPEFLYSLQGASYDTEEGSSIFNEKVSLNYLIVPLTIKIYLNGYADEWFFEAGPQIGFLLQAKKTIDGTLDGNAIHEEVNSSESYSATDLAANIGVGYKFFNSGFFVNVRYSIGLTNINELEFTDNNSVIQLSVGVIFD